MKIFIYSALVFFTAQIAHAKTLKCSLSHFKDSKVPFMTAKIDGENKLSDFKFFYKKYMEEQGATLENNEDQVEGEVISTNRSPYKGNVRYFVNGAGDLILPAKLTNKDLIAIESIGIGMRKGENGVIITSFDNGGDGAGSHVSYRLSCRSDK